MRLFLFLSFLSYFISVHAVVSVLPSNNSQDLLGSAYFRIWSSSHLNDQLLAPLTQGLLHLTDSQEKAFDISGSVTEVTATGGLALSSSQIACIPCDPSDYPGELKVDWTVENVLAAQQTPAAVLLYSESSTHCNISTDARTEAYRYVFTFAGVGAAAALKQAFNSTNETINIVPMSTLNAAGFSGDAGGTTGNSPNTAMVILYGITGIITALFLAIIITGAVRAHRHPERYGPRRVAGRPRQSRARGIARAMLDTIPIVKFDDKNDGVDAAKRDVEMAGVEDLAREHTPSGSAEHIAEVGQTTPRETELPVTEQPSERPTPAPESKPDAASDGGNFSCPICTDDFIKGQDLRVLPCNHQFHPDCVDPWLVNVSGTCPLCRIDLNPPKADENADQEGENAEHAEGTADGTGTPAADAAQARHSHRLTNYLNARRMRNASVEERLAALRRIREANQGEAASEDVAARPSRSRLTTRLRDRFRIRTRAHGESGTATPTVPAPAHTAAPSASDPNA